VTGKYTKTFKSMAISGFVRMNGESDTAVAEIASK
jgi:hypothetical protein